MRCPICHYDNSLYSKTCADCGEALVSMATSQKASLNTNILDGRFEKIKPLALGGMGKVFLGRVIATGDPCIIKDIPLGDSCGDDDEIESRKNFFITEARLLSQLNYPGIPRIFAYYTFEEKGCLVVEYIEGRDFEQAIKLHGTIETTEVIQIALKVSKLLDYLHTQNPPIVFGDLKPSNIILSSSNEVYFVDFGIARLFQGVENEYFSFGSPGYAAPEQYKGLVDPRSDIYAFGATLHYLLVGIAPLKFQLSDSLFKLSKQGKLTAEFVEIIARMLDVNPEKRPQSAKELKRLFTGLTDRTILLDANDATQALSTMTMQLSEHQINTFFIPIPNAKSVPTNTKSLNLPLETKWRFCLGDKKISAPVVNQDLIYLMDEEKTLFALDSTSGNTVWQVAQAKKKIHNNLGPITICEGKAIYHIEKEKLCAVDCKLGTVQWETRLKERRITQLAYAEGEIFFSGKSKNIYKVDARLGELHSLNQLSQQPTSRPSLAKDAIYIGADGNQLYCLNKRDGGIRWQRKFSWFGGKEISNTPIADALIYINASNRHIYALNKLNGETVWEYRTSGELLTDSCIADEILIAGDSSGRLYALSKTTGVLIWRYQTKASITVAPVLTGNILVCGDEQGNIYFLNHLSGELLDYLAFDSPIRGGFSIQNDSLFFTTEKDELICLGSKM